jgi:hypothetical protein
MTLIRLFLAYSPKLRSLASSLSKAVKWDGVAVGCKRENTRMRWRNAAQLLASHNQNPFHLLGSRVISALSHVGPIGDSHYVRLSSG